MKLDHIRIPVEKELGREIYTTIEGEILEEIIRKSKIEKFDNRWKYILEGHAFKVTKEMSPKLSAIFEEVREILGFTEAVDLFVSNSAELNAYSIHRLEDDQAHIININSGLIEKLDDDELKFIMGHELGHLISKNAHIHLLIHFVFPVESRIPPILYNKVSLWEKASELTADRFGFIASPNLEKTISGFFKLSSGLETSRINFDYKAFLAENEKTLEYFKKEKAINLLSHPINPIRVKAIEYFSQSELFRNFRSSSEEKMDEDLEKKMGELVSLLTVLSSSEIDYHRKYFIAAAGLIIAGADQELTHEEIETIIKNLSFFTIFPKEFLTGMASDGKVEEIFTQSAQAIMAINPSERETLLGYCINLVLSDKNIEKSEIELLFHIGQSFGMSEKEIAQFICGEVQQNFYPDLYTLKG